MKWFRFLSFVIVLLSVVSCLPIGPDKPEEEAPAAGSRELSPEEQAVNWKYGFDGMLKDPQTPEIAKQLFTSTYDFGSDEPLVVFDQLKSKDALKRLFYFKAITKISDGYYSEELGRKTMEYIRDHGKDFVAYFDYEECVTDTDLQTWADNVALYFKNKVPQTKDKYLAVRFNESLVVHCGKCTEGQKITIGHFAMLLEENWQNYLAEK